MRGKIIEIEGTDCSGKGTQSKLLCERLNKNGKKTSLFSFPMYDTPTGKIVGGPFLGKTDICPEGSWFIDGADNVSKKISATLYIWDRAYNIPKVMEALETGNVVFDRYADSNLAYNASNIKDKKQRFKMYKWMETMEYKMFGNPKADIRILLYVPSAISQKLKDQRQNKTTDEYEKDKDLLKRAEVAYLELAKRNKYKVINCVEDGKLLPIEVIHEKIWEYISAKLK